MGDGGIRRRELLLSAPTIGLVLAGCTEGGLSTDSSDLDDQNEGATANGDVGDDEALRNNGYGTPSEPIGGGRENEHDEGVDGDGDGDEDRGEKPDGEGADSETDEDRWDPENGDEAGDDEAKDGDGDEIGEIEHSYPSVGWGRDDSSNSADSDPDPTYGEGYGAEAYGNPG